MRLCRCGGLRWRGTIGCGAAHSLSALRACLFCVPVGLSNGCNAAAVAAQGEFIGGTVWHQLPQPARQQSVAWQGLSWLVWAAVAPQWPLSFSQLAAPLCVVAQCRTPAPLVVLVRVPPRAQLGISWREADIRRRKNYRLYEAAFEMQQEPE